MDPYAVVPAKGRRGGIHDLEVHLQDLAVGKMREALGVGILFRIAVVDRVHLLAHEDDVRPDLGGSQGRGGIGAEEGTSQACREDHDLSVFEIFDGLFPVEGFSHVLDF